MKGACYDTMRIFLGEIKMERIYHIGVEATLEVIGGKWKPIILCHLGNCPIPWVNYGKKSLRSHKNADPAVKRVRTRWHCPSKVYNQVPPKVEYSLTEEGKSLREILVAMSVWRRTYRKQKPQGRSHITTYTWWLPKLLIFMTFILNKRKQEF